MKDDLGDRMKGYESFSESVLSLSSPIVVRIDGKRFSKYTHSFKKPYDERLSETMIDVAEKLVHETHADIGYTQSDEITLIFLPKAESGKVNIMFEGRVQKIVSVFASIATSEFAQVLARVMKKHSVNPAYFDARVWNVPDVAEAANTLLWRIIDAERNSVSSIFRYRVGHAQMQNKSVRDMLAELERLDIDIEEYPSFMRYGTILLRENHIVEAAVRTRITRRAANIYRKMPFDDKMKFFGQVDKRQPIPNYASIQGNESQVVRMGTASTFGKTNTPIETFVDTSGIKEPWANNSPVLMDYIDAIAKSEKKECGVCRGRGYIQWHPHWDNGTEDCVSCNGTGVVNNV